MALTITRVFVSELRIRYQLDATADGFDATKTLTQIIADSIPGELRSRLQRIAAAGPYGDGDAAMAALFSQGDLRIDIPSIGTGIGKLAQFDSWGIVVAVDGGGDPEFFPSSRNGGGRVYMDVLLNHTLNG